MSADQAPVTPTASAPAADTRPSAFDRPLVRALAIVTVLFGSSAVALGIAEVAVRLAAPQQIIQIRPDLWQPADSVGYLHRPNADVLMNTGERTVTIRTDEDGFRVGGAGRDTASRQVLLLGDSFMEALQVEHEQTTAHLLEQGLERATGGPLAVRNASVVGWDPNHYRIRARQLLARERFELVVVAVYVANDAVLRTTERVPPLRPVERKSFRMPRALSAREFIDAFLAPINDILETRSHLFVLLKAQASVLRMRLGITADYFPSEYRRAEAGSARWSITAGLLRDIAAAADSQGTPTIFALIPASFQVYATDFEAHLRGFGIDPATVDIDQPTTLLLREMGALGLDVVDALPAFRAASATGERLYGRIDTHFSPRGHEELVAVLLPRALQALARR